VNELAKDHRFIYLFDEGFSLNIILVVLLWCAGSGCGRYSREFVSKHCLALTDKNTVSFRNQINGALSLDGLPCLVVI